MKPRRMRKYGLGLKLVMRSESANSTKWKPCRMIGKCYNPFSSSRTTHEKKRTNTSSAFECPSSTSAGWFIISCRLKCYTTTSVAYRTMSSNCSGTRMYGRSYDAHYAFLGASPCPPVSSNIFAKPSSSWIHYVRIVFCSGNTPSVVRGSSTAL